MYQDDVNISSASSLGRLVMRNALTRVANYALRARVQSCTSTSVSVHQCRLLSRNSGIARGLRASRREPSSLNYVGRSQLNQEQRARVKEQGGGRTTRVNDEGNDSYKSRSGAYGRVGRDHDVARAPARSSSLTASTPGAYKPRSRGDGGGRPHQPRRTGPPTPTAESRVSGSPSYPNHFYRSPDQRAIESSRTEGDAADVEDHSTKGRVKTPFDSKSHGQKWAKFAESEARKSPSEFIYRPPLPAREVRGVGQMTSEERRKALRDITKGRVPGRSKNMLLAKQLARQWQEDPARLERNLTEAYGGPQGAAQDDGGRPRDDLLRELSRDGDSRRRVDEEDRSYRRIRLSPTNGEEGPVGRGDQEHSRDRPLLGRRRPHKEPSRGSISRSLRDQDPFQEPVKGSMRGRNYDCSEQSVEEGQREPPERRRSTKAKDVNYNTDDAPPYATTLPAYSTAASNYLYGRRSVTAALKAKRRKPYQCFFAGFPGQTARTHAEIHALAAAAGIPTTNVTPWQLDTMVRNRADVSPDDGKFPIHDNVCLECSPFPQIPVQQLGPVDSGKLIYPITTEDMSREEIAITGEPDSLPYTPQSSYRYPLLLWLHGVVDMRNVGAIMRTCVYFGIGVILSKRATAGADFSRTSTGASEFLNVMRVGNETRFVRKSRWNGWQFYSAIAPDAMGRTGGPAEHLMLHDMRVSPLTNGPCVIVLGNEDKGLPPMLTRTTNAGISIQSGSELAGRAGVDSLNVGIAAALLIERFLRLPNGSEKKVLGKQQNSRLF